MHERESATARSESAKQASECDRDAGQVRLETLRVVFCGEHTIRFIRKKARSRGESGVTFENERGRAVIKPKESVA